MARTVNDVSSSVNLEGAISSMKVELSKLGLEIVGEPQYGRQSAFTHCKVKVKDTKSNKEYTGYGMAFCNKKDKYKPEIGQYNALQRALFAKGSLSVRSQWLADYVQTTAK